LTVFRALSFIVIIDFASTGTLLHQPKSDAKTTITVDASDSAVGAQLEQLQKGRWVPIAFFLENCPPRNKNTVRSTENCWGYTWLSNTSDIL